MVEALSHEATMKEINIEGDKTTRRPNHSGILGYKGRSRTCHKIAVHDDRLRRPVGTRSTLGERADSLRSEHCRMAIRMSEIWSFDVMFFE